MGQRHGSKCVCEGAARRAEEHTADHLVEIVAACGGSRGWGVAGARRASSGRGTRGCPLASCRVLSTGQLPRRQRYREATHLISGLAKRRRGRVGDRRRSSGVKRDPHRAQPQQVLRGRAQVGRCAAQCVVVSPRRGEGAAWRRCYSGRRGLSVRHCTLWDAKKQSQQSKKGQHLLAFCAKTYPMQHSKANR